MSVEFGNALMKALMANAGVAAALPGGMFWEYLPPSQDPPQAEAAAVWKIGACTRPVSMAGMFSHRECVMEIEFVGAGPTEAKAAWDAIEAWMDGKTNQTPTTVDGTKVNSLVLGDFVTRSEPLNDGSGNEICHFITTISGDLILEE